MMKRICDIILILLVITAIIVGGIIGTEYIRREKNEDKLSAVVAQIENINTDINDKENKQETIKLDGYDVEGIIELHLQGIVNTLYFYGKNGINNI